MHPSEPFPHFVDDYLAYLYEVFPSQASSDGVHLHDDLLEDRQPAATPLGRHVDRLQAVVEHGLAQLRMDRGGQAVRLLAVVLVLHDRRSQRRGPLAQLALPGGVGEVHAPDLDR